MKIFNRNPGQLFAWLTIMALLLPAMTHADDDENEFKRIVFYGDSLSDPGNIYIDEGNQVSMAPYAVIPDDPYASKGGFRFTNGRVWAQKFARELEVGRSGKPALAKPGRFTNYAFGSARARPFGTRPSAIEQYMRYMIDFPGGADPDTLYVLQFGGNDIRDALDPTVDPTSDPETIIADAIGTQANLIAQLYMQGARHFLVADVPDLSLSPAIKLADQQGSEAGVFFEGFLIGTAQFLVTTHNDNLNTTLDGLEMLFSDISITRLSLFDALNEVYFNPEQFGITETEQACISFGVVEDAICDKPKRFVFWDGIHPTSKVHRIVAKKAADLYDDDEDDDDEDDD